jgi:hypothetical protein
MRLKLQRKPMFEPPGDFPSSARYARSYSFWECEPDPSGQGAACIATDCQ